jgi:hypothetical protein
VVEVAGKHYIELPKGRKRRKTIYPVRTPAGYPLAAKIDAPYRAGQGRDAGRPQPAGPDVPQPSVRDMAVLQLRPPRPGPRLPHRRWRDEHGNGAWTWPSKRYVFCTTALFTWKLDAADVSRMACHANYRITLDMYVGTTAGILDRARQATQ